MIKKFLKESINIDPKFLFSIAHSKENVLGIWWYNLETGEIRFDTSKPHSDEIFKDVSFRPGWLRGRVFEYTNIVWLMVYFKKPTELQLRDIIDKLENKVEKEIIYVVDDKGGDISYLLESKKEKMSKIPLNERIIIKEAEQTTENLPKGVLRRIWYPFMHFGKKNENKRVYENEIANTVLNDSDIKRKLETRTLYGNQEHPEESQVKLNKDETSHIISALEVKETKEGPVFYAALDLLPTEPGKFINILFEAGSLVPVSSRADGELVEALDESGEKYSRVIPETYKLQTIDFTGDPSNIKALPESIQDNIVELTKKHYENKEIDKNVAIALFESVGSEKAKKLNENIKIDKQHNDCKCKLGEKKCSGDCEHKNEKVNEKEVKPTIDKKWNPEYVYLKGGDAKSGSIVHYAHKPENVLLVWWYNPSTGEFVKSKEQTALHMDNYNKEVDPKEQDKWIKGRVFKGNGKVYAVIYDLKNIEQNARWDLLDKLNTFSKPEIISSILDSDDRDISNLFEGTCYKLTPSTLGGWAIVDGKMVECKISEDINRCSMCGEIYDIKETESGRCPKCEEEYRKGLNERRGRISLKEGTNIATTSSSDYYLGNYEGEGTFYVEDLPKMKQLKEEELKGFNIRNEDKDKIFVAYPEQIKDGQIIWAYALNKNYAKGAEGKGGTVDFPDNPLGLHKNQVVKVNGKRVLVTGFGGWGETTGKDADYWGVSLDAPIGKEIEFRKIDESKEENLKDKPTLELLGLYVEAGKNNNKETFDRIDKELKNREKSIFDSIKEEPTILLNNNNTYKINRGTYKLVNVADEKDILEYDKLSDFDKSKVLTRLSERKLEEDFQDDSTKIAHGFVCSTCGGTITQWEKDKNYTKCCGSDVVDEKTWDERDNKYDNMGPKEDVEENKLKEAKRLCSICGTPLEVDSNTSGPWGTMWKCPEHGLISSPDIKYVDESTVNGLTDKRIKEINEGLYVYEVTDGKTTFHMTSIKPYKEGEVVYNGEGRVVKVVKEIQKIKEVKLKENTFKDLDILVQDSIAAGKTNEEIIEIVKQKNPEALVNNEYIDKVRTQVKNDMSEKKINENVYKNIENLVSTLIAYGYDDEHITKVIKTRFPDEKAAQELLPRVLRQTRDEIDRLLAEGKITINEKFEGIKSILEPIMPEIEKQINIKVPLVDVKNFIISEINKHKIDEEDKNKLVRDIQNQPNELALEKFLYNAILKYSGLGVVKVGESIGDEMKELIETKIKLAETTALLEKTRENYKKDILEKKVIKEDKLVDIAAKFTNEKSANDYLDQLKKNYGKVNFKVIKKTDSVGDYWTLESFVDEKIVEKEIIKSVIETKVLKEVEKLKESLKEEKNKNAKIIEGIHKEHQTEIIRLKESNNREIIKTYVDTIIESTGLELPETTLTLLRESKTKEEVNQILEFEKKALRFNSSHSEPLNEIKVESQVPTDPVIESIDRKVTSAFKAMNPGHSKKKK